MNTHLKALGIIIYFLLSTAALVSAELSPAFSGWADGPEGFLLTKDELKEWKQLTSDDQAKQFIELFWARRNQQTTSTTNEFKATFEQAVRFADEKFTHEGRRGALTDRGKVLILMGLPHSKERRAPTETVQSVGAVTGQTGMGSDEVRSSAEMWTYYPANLPAGFEIKGNYLLFVFYEDKNGSNNFTLDRSHREATLALRALSRAPEVHLLHPELTEAPKPVSVPGGQPASAEQLAWLAGAEPLLTSQTQVLVDVGVADAVHRPLWLHLGLPAAAPPLDLLAGRVSDQSGTVISTFSIAATPIATATGQAYHLTFPVAVGSYRLEVVGSAAGVPQVRVDQAVTVDGIPLEGTWTSPLWLGLSAAREDGAPLGAPFTFGGWHLTPHIAGAVARNNQLSYFGFVVRPGLGGDGQPSLRARIVLKQNGKRLGQPLLKPLGAAPVAADLYLFADALNLAGFPPGQFEFELTVEDAVSQVETKRSLILELTE